MQIQNEPVVLTKVVAIDEYVADGDITHHLFEPGHAPTRQIEPWLDRSLGLQHLFI